MKSIKKYSTYILPSLLIVSLCLLTISCAAGKDRKGKGYEDIGSGRGLEDTTIPGEGLDGRIYGLSDINFDYDKSTLSSRAQEILKSNATWLMSNTSAVIEIEGHCDERGTTDYNLALGDRRARSARDFIVSLGVTSSRLKIISYGEEMPLDPGHNESAWAKNRRAHFTITSK